ncbi:conserved unknown protein [Ectocarpus siliculosus]|uniref:RING-type E3 ubiquitin transferase n=1 Tax=Ectocarpus siliculosus TaxID=2880 RepID=D8LQ38_ECTSI|nr:conserved unknown protein [Ectocarpus siliculosus]|eukprot:CBN77418.1 conserved unknown protein [Ectocarpus siliculosus]
MALDDDASCSSGVMLLEVDECPSVGADIIFKNITGILGAMVGVALLLNVFNRVSNRRRSRKLKKSIFTLPVYVYNSSTRERAKAARTARPQLQAPLDSSQGIEDVGSARSSSSSPSAPVAPSSTRSRSSSEDSDSASPITCAICLAAYQEEEVIKVLPCGHDFHSDCLDPWLEVKAECPLCKAPAFTKSRDRDEVAHGRAVHAINSSAIAQAPPLFRSRSPDESRGSQLDGRPRTEGGVDGGMPPVKPSSPLPPESSARSTQVGANQEERSLPIERAGESERTPLQARVLEGIQQTGEVVPVRPDWDARGESKMADFTADGQPLAAGHNIAPDTAAAGIGAPIASAVLGSRPLDVGEAAVTARAGSKAADSCANRQGNELGISSSESNIPPSSERGVKTTGVAQPRAAPGFGREEVSLDELETGQVGTGKGRGIADVATDGFSAPMGSAPWLQKMGVM